MQRLIREILNHWRQSSLTFSKHVIGMDIGYAMHGNRPSIQPNDLGITILAAIDNYVVAPYWMIRQHFCGHPHWIDESYGGPDSGCTAGYCPDCQFAFHHTMY